MIAVDSLVHNFLHRTGTLTRFEAEHLFGPSWHDPWRMSRFDRGSCSPHRRPNSQPEFPSDIPSVCSSGTMGFLRGRRLEHLQR